jgi:hypothetical protein
MAYSNPYDLSILLNKKGVQCFKSGKYEEAGGLFLKSIERNSKDPTV